MTKSIVHVPSGAPGQSNAFLADEKLIDPSTQKLFLFGIHMYFSNAAVSLAPPAQIYVLYIYPPRQSMCSCLVALSSSSSLLWSEYDPCQGAGVRS